MRAEPVRAVRRVCGVEELHRDGEFSDGETHVFELEREPRERDDDHCPNEAGVSMKDWVTVSTCVCKRCCERELQLGDYTYNGARNVRDTSETRLSTRLRRRRTVES